MEVIPTHENADFDAATSLLRGKLFPAAIPIPADTQSPTTLEGMGRHFSVH